MFRDPGKTLSQKTQKTQFFRVAKIKFLKSYTEFRQEFKKKKKSKPNCEHKGINLSIF